MDHSRYCQIEFALHWESCDARHVDRRYFDHLSLWRDYLPGDLAERLDALPSGESLECPIDPDEWVEPHAPDKVQSVHAGQFRREVRPGVIIEPRQGRFYPRNLISGLRGVYAEDRRPLRVLRRTDEQLTVDLNHPLAGRSARLEARVIGWSQARATFGGVSIDIPQQLTGDGPGLQAALPDAETDYYSGDAFARLDAREDRQFYAGPRLTQHIDSLASQRIGELYARALRPGMRVLDLMSSWVSHLPDDMGNLEMTGLGMNAEELQQNPRFASYVVQDLNRQTQLPWSDGEFDAALCTVSVEYLIEPVQVFREVARVLKPGAPFIVTFSDRWFPTKTIQTWTEMHAFERIGLVLDYFHKGQDFDRLGSESLRGLPRPKHDKYADQLRCSDPVFAVWGHRC